MCLVCLVQPCPALNLISVPNTLPACPITASSVAALRELWRLPNTSLLVVSGAEKSRF